MTFSRLLRTLSKSFARKRMSARRCSLSVEQLEPRALLAGFAELVEDSVPQGGINGIEVGATAKSLTNVNGTLYFSENDTTNGQELWRIDAAGQAEMVEDVVPGGGLNPGPAGSNPGNLININGTLYFTADDGTNGVELWRINASGVGEMVEDAVLDGGISSGSGSSSPKYLTDVDGTLYFAADDGRDGSVFELWRIDAAGLAELVLDPQSSGGANPGLTISSANLANINGTLYFRGNDSVNGDELWRINAAGNAEMVEDSVPGGGINPGSASSLPLILTNFNGQLYFAASQATTGLELWRINAAGLAELVEDAVPGGGISPDSAGSGPVFLTNVNGTLYFRATTIADGTELWRINAAGLAEMVEDAVPGGGIFPGAPGSVPWSLTNVNGTLYFAADDGVNGYELWRVNGAGQAEIVEDAIPGGGIRPGALGSGARFLTNVNGTLYFRANDGTNGFELWRINASGQAEMVDDALAGAGINPGSALSIPYYPSLTNVNGTLYFRADDGVNGIELWRINASGTAEMVEDAVPAGGINPGSAPSLPNGAQLTNVNGTLYFIASDGPDAYELWRINAAGRAEMIEDAIPGGGIGVATKSSSPNNPLNVNGTLYFMADDGINGVELWRVNPDGQAELVEDAVPGGGIRTGISSSAPGSLTNVNGTLYFQANDGINGVELWRINASGRAEMVEDDMPGGGIAPGLTNSGPTYLTNVNGTLYFQANDGTNGVELWRVNAAGKAELVEDAVGGGGIRPGAASATPRVLTNVNGTLYFRANDGTNGDEVWRINASGQAEMVEDSAPGGGICPGASDSIFSFQTPFLININGTAYFNANDGTNGLELWRINASGRAELVEDAVPGGGINSTFGDSTPVFPTNVNGTLYFQATTGISDKELWRINVSGRAELVEDSVPGGGIRPGSSGSNPTDLTNVSGTLYFKADDGTNGYELWRINPSGMAELVEDAVAGGGIRPGAGSSVSTNPYLTNVNGRLYFRADDGTNGAELWRINASGIAELVEDAVPGGGINPGSAGSLTLTPPWLTNVNGMLYFVASDGANGRELWRINAAGQAEMVEDAVLGGGLNFGAFDSSPSFLTNVNGKLYFAALDALNGVELWRVPAETDPPIVTSFSRILPTQSFTNADSLVFRVAFNEDVQNVAPTSFAVAGASTATVSNVTQVTASIYDVSISGGDLATFNGLVGLNLAAGQTIADLASNGLPAGEPATDETYLLDNTAPRLNAYIRQTPSARPTNADSLVFRVIFEDDVQNVSVGDFAASGTTASIGNVIAVGPKVYDITLSGGDLPTFNGVVALNLAPTQNITDLVGNPLSQDEPTTDETYLLDNQPPSATVEQATTQADPLAESEIRFIVTFDEPATGFDSSDLDFTGSTVAGTLTGTISGTGPQYDVSVTGMTDTGIVRLGVKAGAASDAAGNATLASTSTDNEVLWYSATPLQLSSLDVLELQAGAPAGSISIPGLPLGRPVLLSVTDTRFEIANGQLRLKTDENVSRSEASSIPIQLTLQDGAMTIHQDVTLNVLANLFPWHNALRPEDAQGNGSVTLDDAIFVIRQIRRSGTGILPIPKPASVLGGSFYDVDGNGTLGIQDVIAVIRYLRRNPGGGEGENAFAVVPPAVTYRDLVTSAADLAFLNWTTPKDRWKETDFGFLN